MELGHGEKPPRPQPCATSTGRRTLVSGDTVAAYTHRSTRMALAWARGQTDARSRRGIQSLHPPRHPARDARAVTATGQASQGRLPARNHTFLHTHAGAIFYWTDGLNGFSSAGQGSSTAADAMRGVKVRSPPPRRGRKRSLMAGGGIHSVRGRASARLGARCRC